MDPVTELSSDPELHLLTDWGAAETPARLRRAAIVSVAVHTVFIAMIATLPASVFAPPKRMVDRRRVTPLIAPPFELTQPDPNKGKISKSVNMESLLPRPNLQMPRSAPSTTRPAARTPAEQPTPFIAPPAPKAAPAVTPQIAEPPKIETAMNEGALTKTPVGTPLAPAPQIQAEEKPKLTFETPGAPATSPRQGTGKAMFGDARTAKRGLRSVAAQRDSGEA